MHRLTLRVHSYTLSVVQFESLDLGALPAQSAFLALVKTAYETSVCMETAYVPAQVKARSDGWACMEVLGPLDFALTGILSGIAAVLADAGISIFAISSFNTDFILVKQTALDSATQALERAGYTMC